jgi:hypothetical protein
LTPTLNDALFGGWAEVAGELQEKCIFQPPTKHSKLPFLFTNVGSSGSVFYFSAGVHGDETEACFGLLAWAKMQIDFLRNNRAIIFPCINVWGFSSKVRHDSQNRDLNRCFDDDSVEVIYLWTKLMDGVKPRCSFLLHEDADANGWYFYLLSNFPSKARQQIATFISPLAGDRRESIEGFVPHERIILLDPSVPAKHIIGMPEARKLFQLSNNDVIIIESPMRERANSRRVLHASAIDHLIQIYGQSKVF